MLHAKILAYLYATKVHLTRQTTYWVATAKTCRNNYCTRSFKSRYEKRHKWL